MVHLMFGLEGSGFIISISLTFLLVGLVVYMMKRQMRGLEQKFCSIFELSQNLANSIEHIKSTQTDRRKEVHIENYSESENDTDEEDEEDNCPEGICPINRMFESIKVIDINDNREKPFNFENNALEQMLNPSSIEDVDEKNEENLDDSDDLDDYDEDDEDEEDNEVEEDDEVEENDEAEDDEADNNKTEEDSKTKNNVPNKVTEKNLFIRENVTDYHKLKVPELRDLVVKQKILSEREAKTIKKQELVDLLKKNN